jgi:hypothetical protein
MNTNSINNAQNSYALYNSAAPAATQSSATASTQNTTTSTADTVTISPEALALQQVADGQNNIAPPINTPSVGGGASARPPL